MTVAIKPAKTRRKSKTKVVKIPTEAHAHLAELAADQERSMGDLLADLIEQERRRAFWEETNAAYARLKADPEAWADWQAEIRSMEGTLMDGLDEYPWEE
ncbi:MAG TPA: hypothetical protein VGR16_04725 [Thermomicrobiales bacterium]|nr:hypothetical protein [Thermomicrobiales bacterium]